MNQLKKKLGPLELWQWLAIGTAAGVALYLYRKSHGSENPSGLSPEAEEKLLAGLSSQGGGGGSEFGGGSGVAAPAPLPGLEGAPGPVGPQGPNGEAFNPAPLETRLGTIEQELAGNNPPSIAHNTGAQPKGSGLTKNAKGEEFRTVKRGGKTYHEYPGRTGPHKLVQVGGKRPSREPIGHQHKPRNRPKPTPIHHRVTVHNAPGHRAAPAPVHHPAPKPPAKPKRKRGR